MVTVKKGNIELNVDDAEISKFLANGYDQINGKGRITKQATGGKTVSIEEYKKLLAENAELKNKLAEKSENVDKSEKAERSNKKKKSDEVN